GQGGNGGPAITREATSLGSGFIISPDGYVVTNNHVVAPGAKGATVDSITVTLVDRKEYVAKLIGRDPTSDLALLKIDAKNLPFV
ncbi:S1C family serine protease, partial [Salmonella sp. 1201_ZJHZ21_0201]